MMAYAYQRCQMWDPVLMSWVYICHSSSASPEARAGADRAASITSSAASITSATEVGVWGMGRGGSNRAMASSRATPRK